MSKEFLPINKSEMEHRGWEHVDFVLVTGDAYVDHPSFGISVIGRVLESKGFKVAILAQPRWDSPDDFKRFGKPKLGFLITSGNVDSMVNNYSVWKNKRKVDEYSPGGKTGKRPDRSIIPYVSRARQAYKDVAIVIGGLEASLRRFSHYDYWDDKIRKSILLDSKADILVYGMGEKAIIEIAEALNCGISAKDITWIKGTVVKICKDDILEDYLELPSFSEVIESKKAYGASFLVQQNNNDHVTAKPIYEEYDNNVYVLQNIPQEPLEGKSLEEIYELTYVRDYHPIYKKEGGVPAIKEIEFSITANRGCFGNCNFCAITYHQGRQVRGRGKESIVNEAKLLTKKSNFKGYIHDIGGPTANFINPSCEKQSKEGVCKDKQCLFPKPCKKLNSDHGKYLDILRTVRKLPNVKKVFVKSGIRYDFLLANYSENNRKFLKELCEFHVSGILKVAPEHISEKTLKYMGKPAIKDFEKFESFYDKENNRLEKKQYLIPYLMTSHPGSTLEDALELALYFKKHGFVPDQIQDFYPTPGTLSTAMYYMEEDPRTGEKLYVAKGNKEKKMQKALIHFNKPENKKYIREAYNIIKDERIKKLF